MLKRCSAIFAAIELWLPASSFPISRELQAESLAEDWVIEGNCSVDGACVSSPNFPDPYGNKDYCLISLPKPSLVEVTAFETEKGYDKLTINGKPFSGTSLMGESFTVWTNITWRSDESVVERGWQLCVLTLSCADGLPLIPVSVRDCPSGSLALPSCEDAAPGALCEGDGKCGTRTDVNNCYDESFTYPASRDVYRKTDGSTRTTTATTTLPSFDYSGSWKITGPCTSSGDCVRSGNYPEKYGDSERCVMNMPQPSVINFTAFSTESSYDILTVNGMRYSGSGEAGTVVVAWGNITWQSDASVASDGWELCFVSPKCHDGLTVTPISVRECPSGSTVLPSCQEALPGELCDGDGSCGTRKDINNCYDAEYSYPPSRDVYRKADGSTLTTTVVTVTSTHTLQGSTTPAATGSESPWTVVGPCETDGACVQSPNYPEQYGDNQACNMSLPKPSVVTIQDFLTEPDMDFLTFHGIPFSGRGPNRKTFTLWTNITWRSDASVAERGWRICLDPPPFCSDGLPLTPVPVKDCPDGSTILPSCEEAAPGALCEASGQCGTRTDVNNCYNQHYTYPASRDVYRKFNGTASTTTTKTVTTVTSTTTSSSQSTTLLDGYWDGSAPWTISGCQQHGACVENTGFPEGDAEECEFSLPRPSVVRVTALNAQDGASLVINDEAYTGNEQEGEYFTVWSPISWHSKGAGSKFQLCYEALPLCSDGLQLHPIAIPECPPVGENLPGCDLAAPGELCEGDGKCGTRTDINNCYDASYSYPPSRDVYRKDNGTTQTTTTSITLTLTSTTSTTATHWSSKGHWQYVGPCEVRGNCWHSPEVLEHCTAVPPVGKPIEVVFYNSGTGESLKIDGHEVLPSDQGHRYLVGSQISWSPGTGNVSSWKLCSREPACADGLTLSPAEDCPSNLADLPGCLDAEPGGFCRAGECLTSEGLGNCEGVAVYQKAMGTTRTVTTTLTQTATSTASLWHVEGPCGVSGACAASPNFPEPYGLNERCTLSLPEGTQVTVTAFSTEDFYDRLTINGERYSGPQGLVGQTFVVTSPIEWRSDESNTGDGWQICVGGSRSTTATSTMTSTEFMV